MATETTFILDTNGGASPDYTSMAAFEAGEAADLVTLDEQYTVTCRASDGVVDSSYGNFTDATWQTSATCYLKIWTDPVGGYRHVGVWPVSGDTYRMTHYFAIRFGNAAGGGIHHARVEGIAFRRDTTAGPPGYIYFCPNGASSSDWLYVEHCYFDQGDYTGLAATYAVYGYYTTPKHYISNCIAVGFDSSLGSGGFKTDRRAYLSAYNCTARGCSTGFLSSVGTTPHSKCKNCVAQDCTTGFLGAWLSDPSSEYNCSDDGTHPGGNGQTGEVLFENEGRDDLHLDRSDTVAQSNGTDLSSDADYPISDDIDGEVRFGDWDIGADQFFKVLNSFSADWKDLADLDGTVGTFVVSTDCAKTGTHSYKAIASGMNAGKFARVGPLGAPVPLNRPTVVCGFHFRCSALPTGGNDQIATTTAVGGGPPDSYLLLLTDGKLRVVDAGGNTVGTSTTALSAETWYHIEQRVFSDPSDYENGYHEVKINESSEISGVGVAGQTFAEYFLLGCLQNNSSNTPSYYFDNVTLATDFLGDCRVSVLLVTDDGVDTDWVNGDYQDLDELPPDDATSYVDTSTQDAEQSTEMQAATVGSIWENCTFLGAKTMVRAGRAGTGSTGKAYIKDGADKIVTAIPFTFPSSWTTYCKLYEKALTRNEVDALEPGVIQLAAAPANAARCSALGLQLLWSGGTDPAGVITRVFYNFGG